MITSQSVTRDTETHELRERVTYGWYHISRNIGRGGSVSGVNNSITTICTIDKRRVSLRMGLFKVDRYAIYQQC